MLVKFTPGVNFIHVFTAFTRTDLFALFGSVRLKAARKQVGEIDPWLAKMDQNEEHV